MSAGRPPRLGSTLLRASSLTRSSGAYLPSARIDVFARSRLSSTVSTSRNGAVVVPRWKSNARICAVASATRRRPRRTAPVGDRSATEDSQGDEHVEEQEPIAHGQETRRVVLLGDEDADDPVLRVGEPSKRRQVALPTDDEIGRDVRPRMDARELGSDSAAVTSGGGSFGTKRRSSPESSSRSSGPSRPRSRPCASKRKTRCGLAAFASSTRTCVTRSICSVRRPTRTTPANAPWANTDCCTVITTRGCALESSSDQCRSLQSGRPAWARAAATSKVARSVGSWAGPLSSVTPAAYGPSAARSTTVEVQTPSRRSVRRVRTPSAPAVRYTPSSHRPSGATMRLPWSSKPSALARVNATSESVGLSTSLAKRLLSTTAWSSISMTPIRASRSKLCAVVLATPRSPATAASTRCPAARRRPSALSRIERLDAARNAQSRTPTARSVPAVSPKNVPDRVSRHGAEAPGGSAFERRLGEGSVMGRLRSKTTAPPWRQDEASRASAGALGRRARWLWPGRALPARARAGTPDRTWCPGRRGPSAPGSSRSAGTAPSPGRRCGTAS